MRIKSLSIMMITLLLVSCGSASSLDSTPISSPTSGETSDSAPISTTSVTTQSDITSQLPSEATSIPTTSHPAFIVSFVTNATATLDPVTTSYLEFPPSVTNDPLVLEGWYLDAAFTQVVTFPYRVTSNVTLYAKWITGTSGFNYIINSQSNGYIVDSYAGNAIQVVIPASHQGLPVVELGAYLFYENGSLIQVTIPSTVQLIGYAAFKHATSLTSISIPNSVTHIDSDAFSGAANLSTMTLSNSLQVIGNNAFEGTKITTITLPSTLSEIHARAFADNPLLQTVNLNGLTPPLRFPSSFENCHANLRYKVLSSALNTYQTNEYWQAYSSIITAQ